MPAVAFRGLMWLLSGIGLGSWLGGDTIETQNIVAQTSTLEKICWTVGTLLGLTLIVLGVLWIKKKYF